MLQQVVRFVNIFLYFDAINCQTIIVKKFTNIFFFKFVLAFSESETSYRTRSLPAWGKIKQRPVTITDDIANLYVKVKKRRFFLSFFNLIVWASEI